MKLLLYIICPAKPYRAVVNYYCHTNLVKLLPCIKCHTSYGIIAIYQLSNISEQGSCQLLLSHKSCKITSNVLNVTYLMELLLYINSPTYPNRVVVNYYCHINHVKLLSCI